MEDPKQAVPLNYGINKSTNAYVGALHVSLQETASLNLRPYGAIEIRLLLLLCGPPP